MQILSTTAYKLTGISTDILPYEPEYLVQEKLLASGKTSVSILDPRTKQSLCTFNTMKEAMANLQLFFEHAIEDEIKDLQTRLNALAYKLARHKETPITDYITGKT
jgi:hypothetical protein